MKIDVLNIVAVLFFCLTFVPVTLVIMGTALKFVGVL